MMFECKDILDAKLVAAAPDAMMIIKILTSLVGLFNNGMDDRARGNPLLF